LLVSVALVAPVEKASVLAGPGGLLTAAGRVAGMAGAYLMLVTVLLIGRIPVVERALGQDKLVKLHRRLGPWVLGLIGAHVVLVTLGYAQQVRTGPLHELATMVATFPGMLMAAAGTALLALAGVTSYRYARRHMKYETWWAVHLYTYLAIGLSFWHQIATGAPFLGHPLAKAWWAGVWVLTAGLVLGYRWGLPVVRSLRHRVRVAAVRAESDDVISVTLQGRRLDRLPVSGGQFLHWRFLRRGMWWQAHPYSLSALPTTHEMRITVKKIGDHSQALEGIRPGTRVAIEGPYGAFTHHARRTDRVLLVAAGVGVTPVRALLEDLPRHVDVVAIMRGSSEADLVLRHEIASLVGERGGRLHEVVGPRSQAPLDAAHLRSLVPDIAERDLYVCGPSGFMRHLIGEARALGVPDRNIHHEDFAF
jgi:ferredoxin-NADP reductase